MFLRYKKNGILSPEAVIDCGDRGIGLPVFSVHDEKIFIPALTQRDDNAPDAVFIRARQPVFMDVPGVEAALKSLRSLPLGRKR